ncbi:MAG: phosphoglycerate kinase [Candidatus Paceibacterota bacterium]
MKAVENAKSLKGKRVLLRADLNTENLKDSYKVHRAINTIKFLVRKGAIVIVASHKGKPHGKRVEKESLKSTASALRKLLKKPVQFLPEWDFAELEVAIKRGRPGKIFLLENLRFNRGEEENDHTFAHRLAGLADMYVNDAFASCHRAHASVEAITNYLPSYAGLLLMEEVENLSKVMKSPKKPFTLILGGGKAADKFAVIEKLYPKVNKILVGGVLANTFLFAAGQNVGQSVVDESLLHHIKPWLKKKKIVLPVDFEFGPHGKIYDLGRKARQEFLQIIRKSQTVVWNGPVGYFEQQEFRKGSEMIARAITKKGIYSVVGGGETGTLIEEMNKQNSVSFLSTGGGAMLAFLAGKKMPGIDALRRKKYIS